MFVSATPIQQDRRVKAQRIPHLVRPLAAALLALCLLFAVAAGPATAEAPLSVNSLITDKAGALGADRPQVEAALKQFTRKTGLQLYVIYVKDFDGLSAKQWAAKAAATSTIGSTDTLLAISTSDGAFGVAEPREHPGSDEAFNAVGAKDIQPAVDTQDWAGAATGAAAGYQQAYEESGLPWTPILLGILAAVVIGVLAIVRLRRNYDLTHEIRDEHGMTVDPLELLRTPELVDKAQRAVSSVEDPDLKDKLAKKLEVLLSAKDSRDARRALAISIIHRSTQFENLTTVGSADGAQPS